MIYSRLGTVIAAHLAVRFVVVSISNLTVDDIKDISQRDVSTKRNKTKMNNKNSLIISMQERIIKHL